MWVDEAVCLHWSGGCSLQLLIRVHMSFHTVSLLLLGTFILALVKPIHLHCWHQLVRWPSFLSRTNGQEGHLCNLQPSPRSHCCFPVSVFIVDSWKASCLALLCLCFHLIRKKSQGWSLLPSRQWNLQFSLMNYSLSPFTIPNSMSDSMTTGCLLKDIQHTFTRNARVFLCSRK